jgi:hypothetical protein
MRKFFWEKITYNFDNNLYMLYHCSVTMNLKKLSAYVKKKVTVGPATVSAGVSVSFTGDNKKRPNGRRPGGRRR